MAVLEAEEEGGGGQSSTTLKEVLGFAKKRVGTDRSGLEGEGDQETKFFEVEIEWRSSYQIGCVK